MTGEIRWGWWERGGEREWDRWLLCGWLPCARINNLEAVYFNVTYLLGCEKAASQLPREKNLQNPVLSSFHPVSQRRNPPLTRKSYMKKTKLLPERGVRSYKVGIKSRKVINNHLFHHFNGWEECDPEKLRSQHQLMADQGLNPVLLIGPNKNEAVWQMGTMITCLIAMYLCFPFLLLPNLGGRGTAFNCKLGGERRVKFLINF